MTKRIVTISLTLLLLVLAGTTAVFSQTLDPNLRILEPLVNKQWVGYMKALDSDRMIEVPRRWDVIWDGKAIRYTSEVKELNNMGIGYLYWDPVKQEIALFRINNRGIFTQGFAKMEEGKIIMYGTVTFPDRRLEFRNTLEITPEGKLLDRWFRLEDGEWKAGHVVELEAVGPDNQHEG
jgi:hypothetical protein